MRRAKINLILFILVLFSAEAANAALAVNPVTAVAGETVTASVTGTLTALNGGTMVLSLSFGDGSAVATSTTYAVPGTYTFTAGHSYRKIGNYTVTGTTTFAAVAVPPPPIIETKNITVVDSIGEPPRGTVGKKYEYDLAATSSAKLSRYRKIRGQLPPGLVLEKYGRIGGIPTRKGKFVSTVQVVTRSGKKTTQTLTIFIDPGQLVVRVSPAEIDVGRGAGTRQKITFTVVSPTVAVNEIVRSTRGEFLAGGRVLGYNNTPLNISLNKSQPSASETVAIPASVLSFGKSAGSSKIVYRRNFTAPNFRTGSGTAKVNLRSAAAGRLRITRMRVFFDKNNRPLILVTRNSRDLRGVVEIHYNGSGTFKGYWKVDRRIIQRIQKNLYYGKVLTLKTPRAPRLPTYSEGAHRLQFIITEPESAFQKIDFPEAVYHVEAKKAETVVPLPIELPENKIEIPLSGQKIKWLETPSVSIYHIEFYEKEMEEPFFTAYTGKGSYFLSEKILAMKFSPGKRYSFRVRGFNETGELTGESRLRSFTLAE